MRSSSDRQNVRLFGIRHHGPGSARSLRAALAAMQADIVLVEGPQEANALLHFAASENMQPPVALLIYCPNESSQAAYYPFAVYSPEWQAILYGLEKRVPLRMIDLPQSVQMGIAREQALDADQQADTHPAQAEAEDEREEEAQEPDTPTFYSGDPLHLLAEAGGYSESEQWWEHMVEQYRGSGDIFTAILEAMTALREALPSDSDPVGLRREAAMRQSIRGALKEGYQRIAVVCGAWHAPALVDLVDAAGDKALLSGLPSIDVRATWVPWTNARLTRASGYGAGIESPGWYQHLWATEQGITERWLIRVARLLRGEDLDVSPAHVIEAVRLAEALAALRGRPLPGLPELNEAALTVFAFGNPLPMRLIEEQMIVGNMLGMVPPETPMAPLQQDFDRQSRRLKMAPEANEKLLDLDLRRPFDLDRSHLLHRLNLLDVSWGKNTDAALQAAGRGRGGTFHEIWRLRWQPEMALVLIEAGQWGNSIAAAASARVSHFANQAPDLAALTVLVEDVLLAELPDAVGHVMRCLQAQAAVSSDTPHLMQALPPLASVLRYGNVRQTDTAMIAAVVDGLVARICIGLLSACSALNDDAAEEMFQLILKVDDAINRLSNGDYHAAWLRALSSLVDLTHIHGLIAGRAARILMDAGAATAEEAARRMGIGLSTAGDPPQAAAWIEGFLRGSGQLLVHDSLLLPIIDTWLSELPKAVFLQLLPLLRRTFATFSNPERRSIGERIRRVGTSSRRQAHVIEASSTFDPDQAERVLPILARLLGLALQDTVASSEREETA